MLADSALLHSSPISPRSRAQTLAILLQFSSACWVICVWTDWERSGPDPRPARGKTAAVRKRGGTTRSPLRLCCRKGFAG